jgi:hypothetical protein
MDFAIIRLGMNTGTSGDLFLNFNIIGFDN